MYQPSFLRTNCSEHISEYLNHKMVFSSFHGKIGEIPGICVDNFERPEEFHRAYFLSHCHSDHTQGLFSDRLLEVLRLTNSSIYMSEETAVLVETEARNKSLMKYVKTLLLEETLKLPSIPEQNIDELYVHVSQIPAGHCFGSCMFLFKTPNKSILYTGDFRMHSSDLPEYKQFYNSNGVPLTIDALYVDTTFIGDSSVYRSFPKRSECVTLTVNEIQKWLAKDEYNRVALHPSARYVCEYVYKEIFEKLGLTIFVNETMWNVYEKLHLLSLTNVEESTKIHVCPYRFEPKSHTKCLPKSKGDYKYLYIYFSAMKWGEFDVDDNSFERVSDTRIDVCFATHCSRAELLYFVNFLAPKKVEGFPNPYYVDKKLEISITVPKKRGIDAKENRNVKRKVDKELLRKMLA